MSHSVSRRDYSWWNEGTFMRVILLNNSVLIWGPRGEVTVPKADRMSVAEPEIALRFLVPTLQPYHDPSSYTQLINQVTEILLDAKKKWFH